MNPSKLREKRFWNRWMNAGALGSIYGPLIVRVYLHAEPAVPEPVDTTTMTPRHPFWNQFMTILEGPGYIDYRKLPRKLDPCGHYIPYGYCDDADDLPPRINKCTHDLYRPFTRVLLRTFGCDIEQGLAYFDRDGAACDCGVYFMGGMQDNPICQAIKEILAEGFDPLFAHVEGEVTDLNT